MTNDRELLEAAAKAAGMLVFKEGERWAEDSDGWFFNQVGSNPPALYSTMRPAAWRPLTDDGDALRLAVKLGIEINIIHPRDHLELGRSRAAGMWNLHDDDPFAATRRAIVRAAASLDPPPDSTHNTTGTPS